MSKNEQRAAATAARRALKTGERKAFSEALCRTLETMPEVREANVILSYAAEADEIALTALHGWAADHGKTVAFPISYKGGVMEARVPRDACAWECGFYGIWSPVAERSALIDPADIDLVIVPCVAFDANLNRLGHGGGYYDRYLPQCSKAKRICVAFEAQKLPEVAMDAHDASVDAVVTEAGIYRK